eukprot:jgi/Psemu1/303089/fgenesh1_kg.91_\
MSPKRQCYPSKAMILSFFANNNKIGSGNGNGNGNGATGKPSLIAATEEGSGESESDCDLFLPPPQRNEPTLSLSPLLSPSPLVSPLVSPSPSRFRSRSRSTLVSFVPGEDDPDVLCVPEPPSLRRRSTIRDSFDLAGSMEEFAHNLATTN